MADVDEVGVVEQVGLLHGVAAHLPLHRHREGGVLRIEHQGALEADAVAGEPVLQAAPVLGDLQPPLQADVEGRGGEHHGAALHEELVQGEHLLRLECIRGGHHQDVRLRVDLAGAQVHRHHPVLLLEEALQQLEGVVRPGPAQLAARRRILWGGQGHGLEHPLGEALERRGDGGFHPGPVEFHGQRHLHGLGAVVDGQVEPERLGGQQAGDHRLHAEIAAELACQLAALGLRVGEAEGKFVAALFFELLEQRGQLRLELDEHLGQTLVRRQVAAQPHRRLDAGEQVAAALVAVEHLLDRPGDVVFRVAQLHVQAGVRVAFHLDQVLKPERFEFVAVLDEDVEIGVGHRRLVARGGLERHRADGVLLARLLLQFRPLVRVDDLHPYPAAAGHLVLAQQVAQLRLQRGEQRVGLAGEVAADEERLLQPAQVGASGVRDRVDVALGEVGAQAGQRRQPEVGRQEVGREQHRGQRPAPVHRGGGIAGPAPPLEGVHIEGEEQADQAERVDQVAQVDHPAGDAGKARTRTDELEQLPGAVAEEARQGVRAEQVECAAGERGHDQADDLAADAGADEQADGDVGPGQAEARQVAAEHRAPVEPADQADRQRQRQGERERDGHQRQAGEELAAHQGGQTHRRGDERLQGAGPVLLGPGAHGDRRRQEDEGERQPLEHGPHIGDVAAEPGLHPEDDEQGGDQEGAEKEKGGRGGKKAGQLPPGHGAKCVHCSLPPFRLMSVKIFSRSRASGPSPYRFQPARATAAAATGASSSAGRVPVRA